MSVHGAKVLILDFGSQYTQLIARRIREQHVYCEILPCNAPFEAVRAFGAAAIVLSGGPASVLAEGSPTADPRIFELGLPILGICYGLQLMAHQLGGRVMKSPAREFGHAELRVQDGTGLFAGLAGGAHDVWMSHGDKVEALPPGFEPVAHTANSQFAAIADRRRRLFGLQFHPEVVHTPIGAEIIGNFLFRVAGLKPTWTMGSFIESQLAAIRDKVGSGRVICALSGGVDSTVVAALLHRAIGRQLTCIFVDNGLLRLGEVEKVEGFFRGAFDIDLYTVRAAGRFLDALRGVTDPEQKRKIIGRTFIEVFEAEAKRLSGVQFLAQGTLYPDVIESVSFKGPSATIKSHHNVGGLPERMNFALIEPLRELFKDEVRAVGAELGIPRDILVRQPFPGPGLAIRVLGEVTAERLEIIRQADAIVLEEFRAAGWYEKVWQSFAVLLPVQSVGVMGDERTYEEVIAVRAVESLDGMTADWADIPRALLGAISRRIINEVRGINRVVYDISSKPPATIEWE